MQPVRISDAIAFVNPTGRKLYKLDYNGVSEDYDTRDLSVLSEHITDTGITSMAFQRNPDEILWATLLDGTLISMTYDPEQDVIAWARHPLPSGGEADANVATLYLTSSEYPTLQALTVSEIPTAPTEPADIALSGATSVTTAAGLQAMTAGNHYSIDANINMSGESWTPLDWSSAASQTVVEGNGHTISNLSKSSGGDDIGFIGEWSGSGGGQIRNLNFSSCSMEGNLNVGILAGEMDLTGEFKLSDITFTDCSVTVNNTTGGTCVAALYLEDANGYVYDCSATNCTVSSSDSTPLGMGVMFGVISASIDPNYHLYVVDCNVSGGSMTQTDVAGGGGAGFVEQAFGGTRDDAPNMHFFNCWTSAAVNVTAGAGATHWIVGAGFATAMVNTQAVSCYSSGTVTLNQSYGSTDRIHTTGGFVGGTNSKASFIDCNSSSDIVVPDYGAEITIWDIGGFVGEGSFNNMADANSGCHFLRCYSTGDISIASDCFAQDIGGFAGRLHSSVKGYPQAERCWSTSDLLFTGPNFQAPTIDQQYGGFVGDCEAGPNTVEPTCLNCYAWGSVLLTNGYTPGPYYSHWVGGFCGTSQLSSASLCFKNCYAAQTDTAVGSGYTAQLTDDGTTRGFGGFRDNTESAPTLFWDTETSSVSTSAIGTGHVTSWMQTQTNYEAAGWDFDTIWYMPVPVFWKNATNSNGIAANSVCVIPGTDEDEVWVSVGRSINGSLARTIERMKPRDWGTDMEDMFFIDSGLTYDSTATTTISGLSHLEGETVAILGDGAVLPSKTVSSGAITLDESVSVAQVGLPFTYKLKPMRMDQNTRKGTTKGSIKKITEVVISFFKTLNAEFGDGTTTYKEPWRETSAEYGTPPDLFTGDKLVNADGGFDVEDPFQIEGNSPMPCSVRAIIPRVEQTGR
jgi:hypothetical protein